MHDVPVGLVFSLLVCSYVWLVNSKTRQIDSSHHSRFARQVRESRSHRDTRQARPYRQSDPYETKCNYSIALLDFPPYIMNSSHEEGFMYEKIKWFVDFTCFNRDENDPQACKMVPIYVRSWLEMVDVIKRKKVDFAFPIQADAKTALKDEPDVTLIRAFVSSGYSLIMNMKQCQLESREQLFISITSQWPILAAMILLSGISGIIIWILERRAKEGQFSSSFTAGLPEGYWWAVLSLATVGYGDVTPKSVPGRMFGIIWVLVGAVMMSLFTATVINTMQTAVDGANCKDIQGKELGLSLHDTELQAVATDLEAKYIKFNNLEEMQRNLSQGIVGRVLVDRNTAFHFLDKSGLKKNRQIRLIRNIEYPLDYYLAHVTNGVPPTQSMSPNDTDDSYTELVERKKELAECGPLLKRLSVDLVGVARTAAEEQLIPAELQTIDLEGLFSTGLDLTIFALYCLVGIFFGLIFIGISCEVYTRCHARALNRRKESLDSSRSPSPYQLENMTSNKLQTWQDHDVRNLITSWADHKHMFGGKQRKKEIFDKIATDFNAKSSTVVTGEQCMRKWGKLVSKYKEIEDHNIKTGNDRKTWKFHDEISQCLSQDASVNPVCTMESSTEGPPEVSDSSNSRRPAGSNEEESDVDESGSAEGASHESSSSSVKRVLKQKKRTKERTKSKSSAAEMLEFLQTYTEKRQKVEEEKVKLLKEMKEEKQAFFNRLLDCMEKSKLRLD